MCGRASLTKNEKELEARFQASFYSEDIERYNPLPNFNVAPTHRLPVITNEDPGHFRPLSWGLLPFWAKDEKIAYKMINARVETLEEKPAFRQALHKRRCLVPLDGFYEWERKGKDKLPYNIRRRDGACFAVAGLWEQWKRPGTGEVLYSFTIVTHAASDEFAWLHDRMPAMMLPGEERLWIDPELSAREALGLIRPYPYDLLEIYRVSPLVNNVRHNEPSLIEPLAGG